MADNDDVVLAFVEICSRLDRLIAAQELTNSVLMRLTATMAAQRLESQQTESPKDEVYPISGMHRGLGSLIPRS